MPADLSSAPTIRAANEADAAAIAAIYAPYVRDTAVSFETDPPNAAMMAQRLAETLVTHPWLVAESAGGIAGFAYAGKHRERPAYRWTVDVTVYVSGQMRRRGIGRALYRVLLDVLRRQGFRSAFAEIVLPNTGSVRLHESSGFMLIGIHKDVGFKLGRWHDIGYWRNALSAGTAPPVDPIPFAAFRQTPEFAAALIHDEAGGRTGHSQDYLSVPR
jgi:L-amino acid N-acyltransferase YncA